MHINALHHQQMREGFCAQSRYCTRLFNMYMFHTRWVTPRLIQTQINTITANTIKSTEHWQTPPDPGPHGNADTYWLMDVSMDTCHRGDRHHVSLSAVPSKSKRASKVGEGGEERWTRTEQSKEKLRLSDSQCCSALVSEVFSLMQTCLFVSLVCRWTYGHLCPFPPTFFSFTASFSLLSRPFPAVPGSCLSLFQRSPSIPLSHTGRNGSARWEPGVAIVTA